jgi:hypothetical protein
MPRILALAFCVIALPVFADPIPKPSPVRKIQNTYWEGIDSMGLMETFRFLPKGVLEFSMGNGPGAGKSQNGTWKQDGKKITWECNNKYAEYTAKIENNEIKVEAKNIKGVTWTVTLKEVKGNKPDDH